MPQIKKCDIINNGWFGRQGVRYRSFNIFNANWSNFCLFLDKLYPNSLHFGHACLQGEVKYVSTEVIIGLTVKFREILLSLLFLSYKAKCQTTAYNNIMNTKQRLGFLCCCYSQYFKTLVTVHWRMFLLCLNCKQIIVLWLTTSYYHIVHRLR